MDWSIGRYGRGTCSGRGCDSSSQLARKSVVSLSLFAVSLTLVASNSDVCLVPLYTIVVHFRCFPESDAMTKPHLEQAGDAAPPDADDDVAEEVRFVS